MLHKTRLTACLAVLLLLAALQPTLLKAQTSSKAALSLSYFGEYIGHPGFKAGIEKPLIGAYKPGKRHGQLLAAANMGGYYHKGNHTGLFLNSELGYRFVTKGGFKVETFMGLGYHRSFIDGPVFLVDDAGAVQQQRLAGQNTMLFSLALGFGKVFKHKPVAWHIRPGIFVRGPHNSVVLPHIFIETGISYLF